jgi:hypothetical protein
VGVLIFIIPCELETMCSVIFKPLHIQGRFKSAWGPRPVSVRDPRALKSVGECYTLYYLLEQMKTGSGNQFLLHLKALGAFYRLVLDNFRARLAWGPISTGALGHGLLHLWPNPPLFLSLHFNNTYKWIPLGITVYVIMFCCSIANRTRLSRGNAVELY